MGKHYGHTGAVQHATGDAAKHRTDWPAIAVVVMTTAATLYSSAAALYALLSALADVPIRQGIAVTGSVNQRGEVQAIGGVNLKIEGFLAVCEAQGLDGRQGVIIPASNAGHLMLKPEVVEAVGAGLFHIWAVHTVDEGITLLTGVPAERIHDLVQQRLRELASRLMQFRGRREPAGASTSSVNGTVATKLCGPTDKADVAERTDVERFRPISTRQAAEPSEE